MLDIAAQCTTHVGCGLEQPRHDGEAERPLYDGLRALDLETMTLAQAHGAGDGHAFDLIVAADVLVYFGRLGPLLLNFARLSAQGAPLIFSCERATADEAPEEGWRLLPSGRFVHTKEYVLAEAAAAGCAALAFARPQLFILAACWSCPSYTHFVFVYSRF
jgi:predicted TPR repeat methyltransferase